MTLVIVQGRSGAMLARVEGVPIPIGDVGSFSGALRNLADRLSGVAWSEGRSEGEVLADASSSFYGADQ